MRKNPETVTGGNVTTPAAAVRSPRWLRFAQIGIIVYEALICIGRWIELAEGHGSLFNLIFSHVCLAIVIFFALVPPLPLGRFVLRMTKFLHLR